MGNVSIVFQQFQALSQNTYLISKDIHAPEYAQLSAADSNIDGAIDLAEYNRYLQARYLVSPDHILNEQLASDLTAFLQPTANTPEAFHIKKNILHRIQTTYGGAYTSLFRDIALNENCLHTLRALSLQYIDRAVSANGEWRPWGDGEVTSVQPL